MNNLGAVSIEPWFDGLENLLVLAGRRSYCGLAAAPASGCPKDAPGK